MHREPSIPTRSDSPVPTPPLCRWAGPRAVGLAGPLRPLLGGGRPEPVRRGMNRHDFVIVGGGIAGASLGAVLADRASVLMLEMEPSAGYHATGRAVSFWEETYGGLAVQPLTTASGPMLAAPDPDFCERPFLTPRRTLHVGRAGAAGIGKAWGRGRGGR